MAHFDNSRTLGGRKRQESGFIQNVSRTKITNEQFL